MSETPEKHPSETVGILYAGAAFSLWGIVPLYWDYLSAVPPIELSIHRMLWCALSRPVSRSGVAGSKSSGRPC